ATTQTVLRQMACLGDIAETAMLSIVLGISEEQVHADLWPSVRQEFVEPQAGAYRFVHDRIQEAAYALIPEDERPAAHLQIGRLLATRTAPEAIEDNVFEIVSQLNRGAVLIAAAEERLKLAGLNLLAGLTRLQMEPNDRDVEIGLAYLRRVGIDWPTQPTTEEVGQEYERMWRQIGVRPIEMLLDLPWVADPVARGTMDVLTVLVSPA